MVAEPQLMTAFDFAKLPEQRVPTELIDGEVIVSPTPTYRHNLIAFRLAHLLTPVAIAGQLGEWNAGSLDLFVSPSNVFAPDAVFFDADRPANLDHLPILEVPGIVVEVTSPSSRSRDRIRKRSGYADRGIPEYWIIEPETRRLTFNFLSDEGAYIAQVLQGDMIPAGRFAGAKLDLDWLFGK